MHLAFSLAGQAAVSIENAQLYAQIEHLFDCFVKASVTAIDQRDPATAGHSIRVATLVTDLAVALERSAAGSYRGIRFTRAQMREMRYAALLHDFGKVGVREEVLIKERKLPPFLWERVHARFELIRSTLELDHERKRARARQQSGDSLKHIGTLDAEFNQQMAELDRFQSIVAAANEPTPLTEEADAILVDVANHRFARADGQIEPYLTEDELHYLRIPHGSLDDLERLEIEAHAEQTFFFLSRIPWTDDLKEVARYASGHHEKLNGTGYPRRLAGNDIPGPDAPCDDCRHLRRAHCRRPPVQASGACGKGARHPAIRSQRRSARRGSRAGHDRESGLPPGSPAGSGLVLDRHSNGSPFFQPARQCLASLTRMRMQPCEAARPIDSGSFVPWM